jgi:hypothetical protein
MNLWLHSARKEALAIGPIWLAACLGVAAAPLWHAFTLEPLGIIAYVFGSVAIGAQVMGHEYSHRTLPSLLAQPVRRATIVAIKLAVLAVALLTLTAVASVGPYSPIARFPMHATLDSRVIYLPTLMGLTLAPYLALIARSTLGGAVFSIGVPGVILVATDLIGTWIYGVGLPGAIDRLKYEVFPLATVIACACAAIALWRRFERLEALGEGGGHVSFPIRDRSTAAHLRRSKHRPLWLLAAKEVRLQQMTFVVAGLYVIGFTTLWWFNRPGPHSQPVPWQPLIALYSYLVSVLVGALASAEERQLGTLDWQGLLPISRRTQFAVKIVMVIALTIVCAVLLPAVVARSLVMPDQAWPRDHFFSWLSIITVGCAMGGLYVSTWTASGVKAVAVALPFVAGSFILLRTADMFIGYAIWHGWIDRSFLLVRRLSQPQAQLVAAAVVGWIAIVALAFAYRNHWSAGKSARVAAAQTATIVAATVVGGVAMTLLGFR